MLSPLTPPFQPSCAAASSAGLGCNLNFLCTPDQTQILSYRGCGIPLEFPGPSDLLPCPSLPSSLHTMLTTGHVVSSWQNITGRHVNLHTPPPLFFFYTRTQGSLKIKRSFFFLFCIDIAPPPTFFFLSFLSQLEQTDRKKKQQKANFASHAYDIFTKSFFQPVCSFC